MVLKYGLGWSKKRLSSILTGHLSPSPPSGPHPPAEDTEKTIYQILSDDPKFSRVFKLVNSVDDVTRLLNDSSANVTFFAPPDWALRKGGCRRHAVQDTSPFFEDDRSRSSSLTMREQNFNQHDLFQVAHGFIDLGSTSECNSLKHSDMAKIIRAVLLYHILPAALPTNELAKNTTRATNLTLSDGSLGGEPLRVRVSYASRIAPILAVNVYAKIVKGDISAANGIIHEINHPLLPPPTIFESLFLLPDIFSTLTSALGRVGIANKIDYHHNGENGGTPAVTFFAPTNKAFDKLPRKLKFYLFSPFGEKALKKLLEYHIAPGFILHSDWVHNVSDALDVYREDERSGAIGPYHPQVRSTSDAYTMPEWVTTFERLSGFYRWMECEGTTSSSGKVHVHPRTAIVCPHGYSVSHSRLVAPGFPLPRPPPPVFERNLTVPTLLSNHSLGVYVTQFETKLPLRRRVYHTHVLVDHQLVTVSDLVARNGAFHVVERVLNPIRHPRRHPETPTDVEEDEWQDWEEWLPRWAEEN
ncbi:FAS1 domain-containing protein [Sparassis latifolia]